MAKGSQSVASPAVQREWLRRVEEEYRSAAIAQQLGLWLTQIALSPDLVRAALRIAADELTHAELSHRTFLRAGGEGGPTLSRETLGLRVASAEVLEQQVTRAAVRVFCLGETIAVPLFKRMRDGCTIPVARRALNRILRDEVRHRDFGWCLLDALLELPLAPALRLVIERELPAYFGAIRRAYASASAAATAIPDADRVWGLIPPADYVQVVERTFTRDWLPRFRRRGIDPSGAWTAASVQRGATTA